MEKVATIIRRQISGYPVESIYLVGGTVVSPACGVVEEFTGIKTSFRARRCLSRRSALPCTTIPRPPPPGRRSTRRHYGRLLLQLRCYSSSTGMQPQFAAFVGTITQGDLPTEGMASLYIEMAPGNEPFAWWTSPSRPPRRGLARSCRARVWHVRGPPPRSQAEVLEAGRVVLDRLGLQISDRVKPEIASVQVITNVDPYQAQLLNRFRRGSMLVPGETMLVLECAPAAYINFAANEAEKGATIRDPARLVVGRFGRMWLSGSESEINTARQAAVARSKRSKASQADRRRVIRMPKTFYHRTRHCRLALRGVTSLEVNDDVVLTDLARDEALKRGVKLTRPQAPQPEDQAEAELVHRVKAAVIARLGSEVDAAVLDAAINRVVKGK